MPRAGLRKTRLSWGHALPKTAEGYSEAEKRSSRRDRSEQFVGNFFRPVIPSWSAHKSLVSRLSLHPHYLHALCACTTSQPGVLRPSISSVLGPGAPLPESHPFSCLFHGVILTSCHSQSCPLHSHSAIRLALRQRCHGAKQRKTLGLSYALPSLVMKAWCSVSPPVPLARGQLAGCTAETRPFQTQAARFLVSHGHQPVRHPLRPRCWHRLIHPASDCVIKCRRVGLFP